jgi:MFS family permease
MSLYTKNMLILLVTIGVFFFSFYILLPVLPVYVQYLGGTQIEIGVTIGIFTASSVLVRPFVGKYTDTHGRKPMLVVGAIIFLISPFLYMGVSTVFQILLVRIIHGIGIATFTTSAVTMIADISPDTRRGEAFGAFGLAAMVALSGAPATGIWVYTAFSFSAVFWIGGILGGFSLVLSFAVAETFHHPAEFIKNSVEKAYIPSIIIFLCTVTYGSIVAFLPFFASDIPAFGLYYTAYAISSIAVRLPIGRVSDRIGYTNVIIPGLVILSVALLVLSQSYRLSLLILSGILYGIGFSSVYPTLTALLVDKIPKNARARGLAMFTASFDLGIAAGSIGFGLIPLSWMYLAGAFIIGAGLMLFWYMSSFQSF